MTIAGGPDVTAGLVCAHHHLYSALARGMPAPPRTPTGFLDILELIWWRLDVALDHDMLRAGARLAALEALESGTTAIVDHHESPSCIEGSLDVLGAACAEVGVRYVGAYGVTDRHRPGGDAGAVSDGARRGLEECRRFVAACRDSGRDADGSMRGMVGVHAAFTCSDDTLAAAASTARDLGVGVHVHVAEGAADADAHRRLAGLTRDDWILVHAVHLPDDHGLAGTIVHNPRSNMNNAVGYARPTRFTNPVALGTDGIGAAMLDEARLAYVRLREDDVTQTPDTAQRWLDTGATLVPEVAEDRVRWSYAPMEPWHLAFTTDVRALDVDVAGRAVLRDGRPTRVDAAEIRAHAAEQAQRLFGRL